MVLESEDMSQGAENAEYDEKGDGGSEKLTYMSSEEHTCVAHCWGPTKVVVTLLNSPTELIHSAFMTYPFAPVHVTAVDESITLVKR